MKFRFYFVGLVLFSVAFLGAMKEEDAKDTKKLEGLYDDFSAVKPLDEYALFQELKKRELNLSITFLNDITKEYPRAFLQKWFETINNVIADTSLAGAPLDLHLISVSNFEYLVKWALFFEQNEQRIVNADVAFWPLSLIKELENMSETPCIQVINAITYLDLKIPLLKNKKPFPLIAYCAGELRKKLLGESFEKVNQENLIKVASFLNLANIDKNILKDNFFTPFLYNSLYKVPIKNLYSGSFNPELNEIRFLKKKLSGYDVARILVDNPSKELWSIPIKKKSPAGFMWGVDATSLAFHSKNEVKMCMWQKSRDNEILAQNFTSMLSGSIDQVVIDYNDNYLAALMKGGEKVNVISRIGGDFWVVPCNKAMSIGLAANSINLAVCMKDGSIGIVYEYSDKIKIIQKPIKDTVQCLCVHPSGDLVLWITKAGIVYFYDVNTSSIVFTYKQLPGKCFLSCSRDGNYVVSADNKMVRVVSIKDKEIVSFIKYDGKLSSCAISADGKYITLSLEKEGIMIFERADIARESKNLNAFLNSLLPHSFKKPKK